MSGWRDFTELKQMLRAVSDSVRLNILHQLAIRGEITVTDLVSALEVSQPLVSWHLSSLRRHGFVRTRRHGREVYCSLDAGRFAACQRALGELVVPQENDAAPQAPRLPPSTADPRAGAGSAPRPSEQDLAARGPRARAGPVPG